MSNVTEKKKKHNITTDKNVQHYRKKSTTDITTDKSVQRYSKKSTTSLLIKTSIVTAKRVQHNQINVQRYRKKSTPSLQKKSTLPLKEYNVGTENSNVNDSLSHYRLCSLWAPNVMFVSWVSEFWLLNIHGGEKAY